MSSRLYIGGSPNLIGGNIFDDIANGITNTVRFASNIIPLPGAREVGNLIADGGDAMHRMLASGYDDDDCDEDSVVGCGYYGGKGEYHQLLRDEKELKTGIQNMKKQYKAVLKKFPKNAQKLKAPMYAKIDGYVKAMLSTAKTSFDEISLLVQHIDNLLKDPHALSAIGAALGMPMNENEGRGAGLQRYWETVRNIISNQYKTMVEQKASKEDIKNFLIQLIHKGMQVQMANGKMSRTVKLHQDNKYDVFKPLAKKASDWGLYESQVKQLGQIKIGAITVKYGKDSNGNYISLTSGKKLAPRTVAKIEAQEADAAYPRRAASAAAAEDSSPATAGEGTRRPRKS